MSSTYNDFSLHNIPLEFRTKGLCSLAAETGKINSLSDVPFKYRTIEICQSLINKSIDNYKYVPDSIKSCIMICHINYDVNCHKLIS